MKPTQSGREVTVSSPLGEDVLLFFRMKASEQLGKLFRFDLELLSQNAGITFEDIIGQSVTVKLAMAGDKARYFNGYVTRFALAGQVGRLARYEVTLRPWLWFLTRTADCRIFPDKSKAQKLAAPKIIMEVFREHGFTEFDDHLQETYKEREHCVQYRETDFDFVMRLMEDEGIYYYFKHEDGKHTLVLCDSYSSHDTVPEYENVPFFPPGNEQAAERDHLSEWSVSKTVQSGMYALRDFDFELPRKNLEVKSSISREHPHSKLELFDYPGAYVDPADGDREAKQNNNDLKQAYEKFAKSRIEERQARYERVRGKGNVRGLFAGALFTLADYPRDDQCREYLIVDAKYEVLGEGYDSASQRENGAETFVCSLGAVDAKQPYRPRRVTAKPLVAGPQTAIVVGKDGEEIWTDIYGRVKVQFHWDRYSKGDETSSCWVRVSQNWAGKNWGSMFLPHIGQEVIVEFLEGDPDRPIITGRVYNADNMPPLELPKSRYSSILRDQFGNELIFNGKAGEGNIMLRTPSHESGITLGNSSLSWTQSDDVKITAGNSTSKTYGNSRAMQIGDVEAVRLGSTYSLGAGNSTMVFGGGKLDVFGGFSLAGSLAVKVDLGAAAKVSYSKGPDISLGRSQFIKSVDHDITLDSNETLRLVAGKNDEARITMSKTGIDIVFGKDKPAAVDKSLKRAALASLAAFSGYAASVAASSGADLASLSLRKAEMTSAEGAGLLDNLDEKQKATQATLKSEEWSWDHDWRNYASAAGAMAVPVVIGALALAKFVKDRKAEAKRQNADLTATKHGILHMDEKMIQIQSGEEIYLRLDKGSNAASLMSGGAITIAGKTVTIAASASKPVAVQANELNIKAVIKHASLKVTE